MPAALIYSDGSYTEAVAVSLPVFSAPFADQGVNIDYVLTQDFVQALSSYTPLTLDTAHPDYADFKLASESEKRDLGGGLVQWTRTYAKLPDEFSRPAGTVTYNFIGFWGVTGVNVTYVNGRARESKAVPALSAKKFYRTADWSADIPIIPAQAYYQNSYSNSFVDFLADAPPFDTATVPTRTAYDALIAADAFNIVIEPSRVSIWMGNIYMRETLYVKAQ